MWNTSCAKHVDVKVIQVVLYIQTTSARLILFCQRVESCWFGSNILFILFPLSRHLRKKRASLIYSVKSFASSSSILTCFFSRSRFYSRDHHFLWQLKENNRDFASLSLSLFVTWDEFVMTVSTSSPLLSDLDLDSISPQISLQFFSFINRHFWSLCSSLECFLDTKIRYAITVVLVHFIWTSSPVKCRLSCQEVMLLAHNVARLLRRFLKMNRERRSERLQDSAWTAQTPLGFSPWDSPLVLWSKASLLQSLLVPVLVQTPLIV